MCLFTRNIREPLFSILMLLRGKSRRKTIFSLNLSGTISKPDYLAAADDNTVYSGDTLGCLDSSKHLPLPPPFGAPEFGSLTLQSEDELIYAAVGPPTNTASTVVFQHQQLDQQLVIQNRQQLLPLLSQPSFPTLPLDSGS